MQRLLYCVGAAKCGTTWLSKALERNPGICFTPEKEINYLFSRHGWFDRLTEKHRREKFEAWQAGVARDAPIYPGAAHWYPRYLADPIDDAWYRSLFDGTPSGAWACDFSPSTSLISYEGWEHAHALAEDVRYIYVMREMRERLWSHAKFHAKFIGQSDAFRQMSSEEIEAFIERDNLLVDGDYGLHLDAMLRVIPRERILVIDYEEIKWRPARVLRQVERFLGLGRTSVDPDLLRGRLNVSESLPMPADFAECHKMRFLREANILVDLGVSFALEWRARYGGEPEPQEHRKARLRREWLRRHAAQVPFLRGVF